MAVKNSPTSRKTEVLRQLTDYVSERGFVEASLRPMAAAAGTNARMLIYHFNSKEAMVAEIMDELRLRNRELFRRWLDEQEARSAEDLLTYIWNWSSSRRIENVHRTIFEAALYGSSGRNPLAPAVKRLATDWVQLLEGSLVARGFSNQEARSLATFAIAAMRGLMLDLLATGDRARVNAGAHVICTAWKQRLQAKTR
ncbi:MAG: TetR/AcrR family transcriptional regulator [Acidobacteriota bacterium]